MRFKVFKKKAVVTSTVRRLTLIMGLIGQPPITQNKDEIMRPFSCCPHKHVDQGSLFSVMVSGSVQGSECYCVVVNFEISWCLFYTLKFNQLIKYIVYIQFKCVFFPLGMSKGKALLKVSQLLLQKIYILIIVILSLYYYEACPSRSKPFSILLYM